jgi:hypothetical protein
MRLLEMCLDCIGDEFREFTLGSAQFVDISPVARWFFDDPWQYCHRVREYPSLVAPWPVTWMEFVQPPSMRSGDITLRHPMAGKHAGALIIAKRIEDDEATLLADTMEQLHGEDETSPSSWDPAGRRRLDKPARRRRLEALAAAGDLPKWLLMVGLFLERSSRRVEDLGMLQLYLDEAGQAYSDLLIASGPQDAASVRDILFPPFAFALSMLHCKNVLIEDVTVPAKVQRKRQKRGRPNLRFKTLTVEPLKKVPARQSDGNAEGPTGTTQRALHIARGHFKDYRDGGGLFGRLHGLYWWEMHVRGTAAAGAVIKDYEVRPARSGSDGGDQRPSR